MKVHLRSVFITAHTHEPEPGLLASSVDEQSCDFPAAFTQKTAEVGERVYAGRQFKTCHAICESV